MYSTRFEELADLGPDLKLSVVLFCSEFFHFLVFILVFVRYDDDARVRKFSDASMGMHKAVEFITHRDELNHAIAQPEYHL